MQGFGRLVKAYESSELFMWYFVEFIEVSNANFLKIYVWEMCLTGRQFIFDTFEYLWDAKNGHCQKQCLEIHEFINRKVYFKSKVFHRFRTRPCITLFLPISPTYIHCYPQPKWNLNISALFDVIKIRFCT